MDCHVKRSAFLAVTIFSVRSPVNRDEQDNAAKQSIMIMDCHGFVKLRLAVTNFMDCHVKPSRAALALNGYGFAFHPPLACAASR